MTFTSLISDGFCGSSLPAGAALCPVESCGAGSAAAFGPFASAATAHDVRTALINSARRIAVHKLDIDMERVDCIFIPFVLIVCSPQIEYRHRVLARSDDRATINPRGPDHRLRVIWP